MEAVFQEYGNFVITCLSSTLLKKTEYLHGDHTPEDLLDFGIGGLHSGLPVTWYIVIPATVPWSVWFRINAQVIGASFFMETFDWVQCDIRCERECTK